MRQLFSSIFDAVTAVSVVVFVPAAAINRTAPTIAIAVAAMTLVTARVLIERSKLKAR